MQLSIIIVNWKSKDFLRKCLESIFAETSGLQFEVIVIDSASFDGCGEMLEAQFPSVRFIQSAINLGFAKANNVAFAASRGESVLFLNPDTELKGPAINELHKWLWTLPRVGTLGCRLLNGDQTLQTSCIQSVPTILNQMLDSEFLRARWPKWGVWGTAPLFAEGSGPQPAEAISGACVMLKRRTFEEVGGFSEDYFMYAEDIDLSYKTIQNGAINYYIPNATVIHYGGSSAQQAPSNFSVVMMREATWRFLRKTRGTFYGFMFRATTLCSSVIRLFALGSASLFGKNGHVSSRSKWRAVLRWSLHRESCVAKYRPL